MRIEHRIFRRADGCIDESSCPALSCDGACSDGEDCSYSVLTCDSCPKVVCQPQETSNSSKSTPVGAIAGGVVGGVVVIAVLGLIYWLIRRHRKNNPINLDEDEKDDDSEYCISNIDSHNGDGMASSSNEATMYSEKPASKTTPKPRSKRISSYDSFTKPTYPGAAKRNQAAQARRERQRQIVKQANAQLNPSYNNEANPSYRNSMATSVSTGNASNILPIAYIPGVTVRPTKNNTRSIYSSESESIFSDLNTIENASIIGDVIRANNTAQAATLAPTGDSTMTAIKAQPRLVNVDKIEEEDESDDDVYTSHDISSSSQFTAPTPTFITPTHGSNYSNATIDEESDSDVDSDIGEITRAASLRRPKAPVARPDSSSSMSPHTPALVPIQHHPRPTLVHTSSSASDVALSERELVLESAQASRRQTHASEIALDFINFDTPARDSHADYGLDDIDEPPHRGQERTGSPFDDPV
ncbi:hypothetical protein DICA3_F00496 [Diutina catenulata]